ncbi:MAG TPA: hypothetical protein VH482_19490 [Thermomicrobiales bacterium]
MAQALPQVPQLASFVSVSTQTPPQLVRPGQHTWQALSAHRNWSAGHWQTPLAQLVPPKQAVPQAPQLALSLAVFTHWPAQRVCPLGQAHTPLAQLVPPPQIVPQVPQLFASERTSMQPPSQATVPTGHGWQVLPFLGVDAQ